MPTKESNDLYLAVRRHLADGYGVEDIAIYLGKPLGQIKGVVADMRRRMELPMLYRNARRKL